MTDVEAAKWLLVIIALLLAIITVQIAILITGNARQDNRR